MPRDRADRAFVASASAKRRSSICRSGAARSSGAPASARIVSSPSKAARCAACCRSATSARACSAMPWSRPASPPAAASSPRMSAPPRRSRDAAWALAGRLGCAQRRAARRPGPRRLDGRDAAPMPISAATFPPTRKRCCSRSPAASAPRCAGRSGFELETSAGRDAPPSRRPLPRLCRKRPQSRHAGLPAPPVRGRARRVRRGGRHPHGLEGRPPARRAAQLLLQRLRPAFLGRRHPRGAGWRANDLVYYEVMRRAIARGCTRADFGRSKVGTGPWSRKRIWGFDETPLVYAVRTRERRARPIRSSPQIPPAGRRLAAAAALAGQPARPADRAGARMMPEILFLAHRIPYPPDRGDKMRSWHILRHLGSLATVHLAAFADDAGRRRAARRRCARRWAARSARPWSRAASPRRPEIGAARALRAASAVERRLSQPRRCRRSSTASSPSGRSARSSLSRRRWRNIVPSDRAPPLRDGLRRRRFRQIRRLCRSARPPLRRWIYRREAVRLRAWSARSPRRADLSLFVSDAEAALVPRARRPADADIRALPNGIDLDFYDPAAAVRAARAGAGRAADRLHRPDGLSAQCRGGDRLRRRSAAADPPRLARRALRDRRPRADAARSSQLGRRPDVIVTGEVADVRPWLAAAAVVVAPLAIARGVQNKVLEAMAMAPPGGRLARRLLRDRGRAGPRPDRRRRRRGAGRGRARPARRSRRAPPRWAERRAGAWKQGYCWDAQLAPLAGMVGLARHERRARPAAARERGSPLARPSRRARPRSRRRSSLLFHRDAGRHGRDLVDQLDLQPLPADPADHRLAGLAAAARASRSSRPPPGRRDCCCRRRRARLAARRGGRRRLRPPSRACLRCCRARSIACLGKAVARGLAFPLFYALFLVPVGEEIVPAMQTLTAADRRVPARARPACPAHLEGIFITTPTGYFEVAEACAGVKFLIAMARLRRAGRQCLLPLLAAADRLPRRFDRGADPRQRRPRLGHDLRRRTGPAAPLSPRASIMSSMAASSSPS